MIQIISIADNDVIWMRLSFRFDYGISFHLKETAAHIEWHCRCRCKKISSMQISTTGQNNAIQDDTPFNEPVYDVTHIVGGLYADGPYWS
jgi:hypothetical protein